MKKIKKIQGHETTKYGVTFTQEQEKINELIEIINNQREEIERLERLIDSLDVRIDRLELGANEYGMIGETI